MCLHELVTEICKRRDVCRSVINLRANLYKHIYKKVMVVYPKHRIISLEPFLVLCPPLNR